MANDSGGSVAVMLEHPESLFESVGLVTSFGFNGDVTFAPGVVPQDLTFMYCNFDANGLLNAKTMVTAVTVNLEIHNGQNGAAVRSENDDEANLGAFTVANRNDTDGDTLPDHVDDWVTPSQPNSKGVGGDEVDLMKLVVETGPEKFTPHLSALRTDSHRTVEICVHEAT